MGKHSPEQIALNDLVEKLTEKLSPILGISKVWFGEGEASQYTGFSVFSFRKWRNQQTGPVYYRIGTRILYSKTDLDHWIQKHRIERNDHGTT